MRTREWTLRNKVVVRTGMLGMVGSPPKAVLAARHSKSVVVRSTMKYTGFPDPPRRW